MSANAAQVPAKAYNHVEMYNNYSAKGACIRQKSHAGTLLEFECHHYSRQPLLLSISCVAVGVHSSLTQMRA
jgi:hypothetical protein